MLSPFEAKALKLLNKNRRETDGHIYTVPSPDNYPYQWLWDSCFHAMVLSYFDLNWAKQELLSVVAKQFYNGMLPHMIYWKPGKVINLPWGKDGTSTITQPPIIADAVLKIYETDKDKVFLETIYPHLKYFYNYLLSERDARGNHLIGIINPDESGEDNSPRFDQALGLPATHTLEENSARRLKLVEDNKFCEFDARRCMKNFFWVKDVPFNAFMVKNLVAMSKIAKHLGVSEDQDFFKYQANLIKIAMKEYMLEDGIYWSVFDPENNSDPIESTPLRPLRPNYKKIKVKTWAMFAPMYAGICSMGEAKDLVDEHLLNKLEFWLHYPVPTVAMDEPSFNPEGYWRGPTWIATNWFVFHGLLDYGFVEVAKELYKRSRELVTKSGFREQFNPIDGSGEGATNFTWGTLIVEMGRNLKNS